MPRWSTAGERRAGPCAAAPHHPVRGAARGLHGTLPVALRGTLLCDQLVVPRWAQKKPDHSASGLPSPPAVVRSRHRPTEATTADLRNAGPYGASRRYVSEALAALSLLLAGSLRLARPGASQEPPPAATTCARPSMPPRSGPTDRVCKSQSNALVWGDVGPDDGPTRGTRPGRPRGLRPADAETSARGAGRYGTRRCVLCQRETTC